MAMQMRAKHGPPVDRDAVLVGHDPADAQRPGAAVGHERVADRDAVAFDVDAAPAEAASARAAGGVVVGVGGVGGVVGGVVAGGEGVEEGGEASPGRGVVVISSVWVGFGGVVVVVVEGLVPSAGDGLFLWIRGDFVQASGMVPRVGGVDRLNIHPDGDAAGAKEAIVPFPDGGLDILPLVGGVELDRRADAVELGFGMAPGRGLGPGIVVVVTVVGDGIGGRHGFGPQLAVNDLLVGSRRVMWHQVVGKGLPVFEPNVPGGELARERQAVWGRVPSEGDGVYDVWVTGQRRSLSCRKVGSGRRACNVIDITSKVGVVRAPGSEGRGINHVSVGGRGGPRGVVSYVRVPPGRREHICLSVGRRRYVLEVRGHDGLRGSGPHFRVCKGVEVEECCRIATAKEFHWLNVKGLEDHICTQRRQGGSPEGGVMWLFERVTAHVAALPIPSPEA
jgi:hypothetical protein